MRLFRALEQKKMDVRLRDKLVHEGELEKKEVKKYYDGLSDDSKNAVTIEEIEKQRRERIQQNS